MDIITLSERAERIFNLSYRHPVTAVENRPCPAPIQAGELVVVPGYGCEVGVPLKVWHVKHADRDWCNGRWSVIAHVGIHARGPSGWIIKELVMLHISFSIYLHPYCSFNINRMYPELGAVDYGTWQLVDKCWNSAYDEGYLSNDSHNPYDANASSRAFIWHHAWAKGHEDNLEDEGEGIKDWQTDEEYEERKRIVKELSCLPEGLTGSEARDIMLDY